MFEGLQTAPMNVKDEMENADVRTMWLFLYSYTAQAITAFFVILKT